MKPDTTVLSDDLAAAIVELRAKPTWSTREPTRRA
jgi:hypothetical protein